MKQSEAGAGGLIVRARTRIMRLVTVNIDIQDIKGRTVETIFYATDLKTVCPSVYSKAIAVHLLEDVHSSLFKAEFNRNVLFSKRTRGIQVVDSNCKGDIVNATVTAIYFYTYFI